MARVSNDDCPALLHVLAAAQRMNAEALREMITAARAAGMSWHKIAVAIDLPQPTVFRQYQAGSPIVVVRPYHSRREDGG